MLDLPDRIGRLDMSMIDRESGVPEFRPDLGPCWLWLGALSKGYAHINRKKDVPKASPNAHRYVYQILVGDIPDDLQLDHLCRVRRCVNPAHLELVTAQENCLRAHRWKTHCRHGHEFTPENTRIRPATSTRGTQRKCRECDRLRAQGVRRRVVA